MLFRSEAAGVTEVKGMGLLPMDTVFQGEKVQQQTGGVFGTISGPLHSLSGMAYTGYEIHMGRSGQQLPPLVSRGNVYGSYIHGIFDGAGIAQAVIGDLAARKGIDPGTLTVFDPERYKQEQYDKLADAVRGGLDMDFVYRVLNREV